VVERVEEEVRKLYAHIPETIRLKETELAAEERRLGNFLDFIGDGRGSKALGQALAETESHPDPKCLFAKHRPDPDFRYFSKRLATA
jgi:hypothetical protein